MSRLVYQTATLLEKHDPSWFDYILTLLGPYCAKGWDRKENVDRRDNSINVRMTLSTLTYACFYKLHIMFLGLDHEYLPKKCLVNLMKSL